MKMGFTGTQVGMTDAQKLEVQRIVLNLNPDIAIHGDCIGADAEFDSIVKGIGAFVVVRPCNIPEKRAHCSAFLKHPPEDPIDRNHKIVDDSDIIIACPKGMVEELRSGTWATIRYTKKLIKEQGKKKLWIVWPNGQTSDYNVY